MPGIHLELENNRPNMSILWPSKIHQCLLLTPFWIASEKTFSLPLENRYQTSNVRSTFIVGIIYQSVASGEGFLFDGEKVLEHFCQTE